MKKGGRISNHEDLGMSGNREIGLDEHAAGPIEGRSQRGHERRGGDAGRPHDRSGIEPLGAKHHTVRVDVRDGHAFPDLDAEPRQRRPRGGLELLRERGQNPARLHEDNPCVRRVNGPEFVAQRLARSRPAPASSTPVGPPPTRTKVSSSRRRAGSVSRSARSNAIKMRRLIVMASSSVLSPGAYCSHSS